MNISFQGSITYNQNGPDSRNQTLTHNDGRERPLLLHYVYQKSNLNKQLFCKLMFTFHIQYLQQGVQELGTTWQLHSQCKLPLGQQLQKLILLIHYKTDTSVKWTPVVPFFTLFDSLYDRHLSKMDTKYRSQRCLSQRELSSNISSQNKHAR